MLAATAALCACLCALCHVHVPVGYGSVHLQASVLVNLSMHVYLDTQHCCLGSFRKPLYLFTFPFVVFWL